MVNVTAQNPGASEILTEYSRRLIGRRFDDPTVKKDMESWPFKVVDDDGSPKVEVQYLGESKQFSPQEISAMVLTKVSIPLVDALSKSHKSLTANSRVDEGDC